MSEGGAASDLDLLKSAISEAAAIVREAFTSARPLSVAYKAAGSPVTALDLEIDALLKDRLRSARPEYGWLSEETLDDPERLKADRLWVIDPLDGTRAYLKGRPHFTVCGALVAGGEPSLAVVINPMTEETFEAVAGGGARRNGVPLRVSQRAQLEGARMIGPAELYGHPAWPEPWPAMTIDNPNSIAYRLCLIAAGEREGCVRLSSCHDWDVCAGDLIVREAGGRVSSHDGRPFRYNQERPVQPSLLAAGPGLYQEIYRRIHRITLPAPS